MRYADRACKVEERFDNDVHTYTFTGPCLLTKDQCSVTVKAEELNAYRSGKLIQDAMPSLSPEDREFLISGIGPTGWNKIYP